MLVAEITDLAGCWRALAVGAGGTRERVKDGTSGVAVTVGNATGVEAVSYS